MLSLPFGHRSVKFGSSAAGYVLVEGVSSVLIEESHNENNRHKGTYID